MFLRVPFKNCYRFSLTCPGICGGRRKAEPGGKGDSRARRARDGRREIPPATIVCTGVPFLVFVRRHIGLCNFNYFISGNPSNIQRRRRGAPVEGELPRCSFSSREFVASRRRRQRRPATVLFFLERRSSASSRFVRSPVVTFFRQLSLHLSRDLSTSP